MKKAILLVLAIVLSISIQSCVGNKTATPVITPVTHTPIHTPWFLDKTKAQELGHFSSTGNDWPWRIKNAIQDVSVKTKNGVNYKNIQITVSDDELQLETVYEGYRIKYELTNGSDFTYVLTITRWPKDQICSINNSEMFRAELASNYCNTCRNHFYITNGWYSTNNIGNIVANAIDISYFERTMGTRF